MKMRFGMRGLLTFVLFAAAVFAVGGGYLRHCGEQWRIAAQLSQWGATINYDENRGLSRDWIGWATEVDDVNLDPALGTPTIFDQITKVTFFENACPSKANAFKCLPLIPNLEWFYVRGQEIRSNDLVEIARCRRLRRLDLPGCRFNVNDLRVLGHCPALTDLNVSDCGLHDSELTVISELACIEILSLCGNGLSDKGLHELKKLPRLRKLRVTEIDLTLDSVQALAEMPQLECVVCDIPLTLDDAERIEAAHGFEVLSGEIRLD
jgi:hypothetical protein